MSFAQPFTDYEILERVGAGAMGTVFKARQKRLDRIVAIKVLRPSLARNKRYVDRLKREAHIVARFNHPNIVTGYDLSEEGGFHFFVMEFVEGQSLKGLLVEWGSFPEERVLAVAEQIGSALDHAFQKGIIHRDIKPGNVLIEEQTGTAKLTDLGLAKSQRDITLTREGATVGTPQYISPEQARNSQQVDIRTDLYSLGATLYHMATGQAPFPGSSLAEILTQVLGEQPVPIHQLDAEFSDGLTLVIRKLMTKDPELRYQTPRELLDDVQRVRRKETPQVDRRRLDVAERTGRARPVLRALGFSAAVLATLLGAMSFGAFLWGGSRAVVAQNREVLSDLDVLVRSDRSPPEIMVAFDAALGRATLPELQGQIRALQTKYIGRLHAALERLLDEYTDPGNTEIARWIRDPDHWAEPRNFYFVHLRARIEESIGYSPQSLLANSRIRGTSVAALLDRIDGLARDRDHAFLRDYENFLRDDVERRVRDALLAQEFSRARAKLDDWVQAFFAQPGHPNRGQLAPSMDDDVAELQKRCLTGRRGAIEGAEESAAVRLVAEARGEIEAMRRRLEQFPGHADLIGADAEQLEARLGEHHPGPEDFAVERPWSTVKTLLRPLQGALDRTLAHLRTKEVDLRIALALAALAHTGDPNLAAGFLDRWAVTEDPVLAIRVSEYRKVLLAAVNVRHALLRTLNETDKSLLAWRRQAPDRPLDLRVDASDGELVIQVTPRGGEPVQVELADLLFAPLHAQASELRTDYLAHLNPQVRTRGLLIWRCLTDDFEGLHADLPGLADRFVVEEMWPGIVKARQERESFGGADGVRRWRQILALEREARAGRGSLAALEALDEEFQRYLQRFNPSEQSEEYGKVVGIREFIKAERRRLDRLGELQAGALKGARVQVERGDLEEIVDYPPAALRNAPLNEGWAPGPEGLLCEGRPVSFAETEKVRLVFDDIVSLRGRCSVEFELVFPLGNRTKTRLWTFSLRGVGLAMLLIEDDAVVVAQLPANNIGSFNRVQKALRPFLEKIVVAKAAGDVIVRVLPGATHRLRLEVVSEEKNSRRSHSIRAFIDDEQVLKGEPVHVPPGSFTDQLVIVPFSGLELRHMVWRWSSGTRK